MELPDWLNNCWTCDILRVSFEGIMDFSKITHKVFTPGLSDLIVVVLSLFMLIQAGKLLLPFGASERPKDALNTMIIRIVQTVVVLGLLTQQEKAWDLIFYPITKSATALSMSVLETAGEMSNQKLAECPVKNNADERLYNIMDCNVIRIQDTLGFGMKLGFKILLKILDKTNTAWDTFLAVLTFIPSIIAGFVLIIVYGIAVLSVPFRTIDILMKWAVFIVFSPLVLATAIFPTTREFSVNCLKILLHASATWVITSAIAAFGLIIMSELVNDPEAVLNKGLGGTAFDDTFWQLLAIGIILITMLGKASEIAAKAVGSSESGMPSFGSNIFNGFTNMISATPTKLASSIETTLRRNVNRTLRVQPGSSTAPAAASGTTRGAAAASNLRQDSSTQKS